MLVFLMGCLTGSNSAGQGQEVSDLVVGGCGAQGAREVAPADTGEPDEPSVFEVLAVGDDLMVTHTNVGGSCCQEFAVFADVGKTTIEIEYRNSNGRVCDCGGCSYDFSYTIEDVPAGSYSVAAFYVNIADGDARYEVGTTEVVVE